MRFCNTSEMNNGFRYRRAQALYPTLTKYKKQGFVPPLEKHLHSSKEHPKSFPWIFDPIGPKRNRQSAGINTQLRSRCNPSARRKNAGIQPVVNRLNRSGPSKNGRPSSLKLDPFAVSYYMQLNVFHSFTFFSKILR